MSADFAMHAGSLQQRCRNHETREAVCRCPGCQRDFCRECVAEYEGRYLCAACLKAAAHTPLQNAPRRSSHVILMLAGALLAWAILFCAGEVLMTFSSRL